MKVKDLIAELENFDEESEVMFSYNYGDRRRSDVAEEIHSISEEYIEWSENLRMHRIKEDEDMASGNSKTAIILKASLF